jgi:5,10-methylenetetrahydrofolate reductase
MARYIHKNLSHIHIPEEILERIKKAADKERECIKVAAEVASDLKRDGFGGVLISTMGWEHKIPEILDAMRG